MGHSGYYRSPSTQLRSQRRLSNFLRAKLLEYSFLPAVKAKPVLSICLVESSTFPSNMSALSIHKQSCVNIPSTILPIDAPIAAYPIPQLDGATDEEHQPSHYQCNTCERYFETDHDFRWHYESKIGREDCHILKSMLPAQSIAISFQPESWPYRVDEPQDVDLAEINRQQNVRNTLQMIDEALNLLNK